MQELWAAVVAQAVLDALGRSGFNRKDYQQGGVTRSPHAEAREWIEEGGADFRAVCQLADIDPDAVRDAVMSGRVGVLHLAQDRPRPRTARPQEGRHDRAP